MARSFIKGLTALCLSLLMAGCASYGVVENEPVSEPLDNTLYSLRGRTDGDRSSDITVILTFSGGGTRAAAMAYGVMEELRDTNVIVDGNSRRLLDEVDRISSVSGGSFTAAYYGLHGDGIFDIFEDEFLRFDLQGKLTKSVLNPFHWFGSKGRTERSIEMYDKYFFHDATFADMAQPDRPMVIINASDLAHGVRFSFIQDYFNLLCSDLMTFPVSRAVTASSAVPIVFNPVVVENHDSCSYDYDKWEKRFGAELDSNPDLRTMTEGLQSFQDKNGRKYIHFVDGGITDNMGLRAITDIVHASGGSSAFYKATVRKPPGKIVFISVNASTTPASDMDESNKQPSISSSMGAMSGVQLHRYNSATLQVVRNDLTKWVDSLSTPEHPVESYFVPVTFEDVERPQLKLFLNKIPTSFSLTDEQVDTLTDTARGLLRENPVYKKLLEDLGQP